MSTRSFSYSLAVVSGVLLTLSFPRLGHPALAWIALTPLLVALASDNRSSSLEAQSRVPTPQSLSLSRAFLLGLTTGVISFTGTLYWITRVMVLYGDLQGWVAVLVNAALVAYMALFPAIFALVVRRLLLAYGASALLAAPLVWVTTELGRTYLFTGFPWVLLGYSQVTVLPVAQLASVFGVYGVSALVASVSAAAAHLAVAVPSGPPGPSGPSGPRTGGHDLRLIRHVAPMAIVLVGVVVWGSLRIGRSELTRDGEPIRVGLIQGNIDQSEKTDAARAAAIFQDYLRLSRQAIGTGAQLVIWPESSTPFLYEEDPAAADMVRTLARQARVPILFGSDQIIWRETNGKRAPEQYFNSAFLVNSDGSTAGVYRKMHLVPFGEYVPLKRLLFFAAPLVEAIGAGFGAGLDPTVLPVNGHAISVAICYEVVYPSLVRQFVVSGSELLTTITNDAWFGKTSAPYQHFAQASMRAIEEGRYLVRSANTGISGIVDPYGRVLERTGIFERGMIVGEARFLKRSTFYGRHGDVFAYASAVLTAALLFSARRRVQ